MSTLIISPDTHWSTTTQQAFLGQGWNCEVATTGKEAQIKAYQQKFNFFIVDLDIQNYPYIEVCNYIRQTSPHGKLFFTIFSADQNLPVNLKKFKSFGAVKVLFQPSPEVVVSEILSMKWGRNKTVATLSASSATAPIAKASDKDEVIDDTEFFRVPIKDLLENVVAVFDYYMRLSSNRFIKIVHQGEKPVEGQLERYVSAGQSYLYIMKKDRPTFVSYHNDVAKDLLRSTPEASKKAIKAIKSITDKYIEEIFVTGIQPKLIDEGKMICQNVYEAAMRDRELKKLINNLEQFDPAAMSHSFLITFFSVLIAKNLDWVGSKTAETLALGALFHDIGVLQLPQEIQEAEVSSMTTAQRLIYETHPSLGANIIKHITGLNPGVSQIILQHHEHMNGTGYPAGLTGHKIFPLAKIVSLADGFSYFIKENGAPPIEGIKHFSRKLDTQRWYDPQLLRSLVLALK